MSPRITDQHSAPRLLWVSLPIVMAGILSVAIWIGLGKVAWRGGGEERPLEGLGNFGTVPDFSLTERSGKELKRSDLSGKVWVADFIYTSCTDTCPLQSAELAKLQSDLGDRDDVKLVSISVDPERDNPQVLTRYADRFKASPDRWYFLTGRKEQIYRLAQEGFRLSAVPASDKKGEVSDVILHSSRFVIVDGKARIRGYYESTDAEALKRLRRDLAALLQKGKE